MLRTGTARRGRKGSGRANAFDGAAYPFTAA
jgi:hypothetical protein